MKVRKLIIILSLTVIMAGCGSKKKEIDPDAQNVIEEIDKIGDVDLDDEYTIERAREKYDKLDKNVKKQVSNYKVLLDAEDELDVILKETEDATVQIKVETNSESSNIKSDYTISNIHDSWDLNLYNRVEDVDIHIYGLSYEIIPGVIPQLKLYYSAEIFQKNEWALENTSDVGLPLEFDFRDKNGSLVFSRKDNPHVKIDENGYGYIDTSDDSTLSNIPEGEYTVEVVLY